MIQKEYFRISELERVFGFTFEDYLYLSEKFKNPIHFYSHYRRFVLVDNMGWQGPVQGVAVYRGLVRLSSFDRTLLIRNGSINLRQCILDSKEGVHSFHPLEELLGVNPLPGRWEMGRETHDELMEFSIRACVLPSKHTGKAPTNERISSELSTAYKCKDSVTEDAFCWPLKLNEMVVHRDDAEWALGFLNGRYSNSRSKDAGSNVPPVEVERENLLHLTVKKLIKLYPTKAGTGLWSLLREGIEADIDEIDPYSIFIEIGRDELVWKTATGLEQKMTRGAFRNLISKLRKEILK